MAKSVPEARHPLKASGNALLNLSKNDGGSLRDKAERLYLTSGGASVAEANFCCGLAAEGKT